MPPLTPDRVAAQAEMLGNRVAKRFRHLHPRFERAGVGAFRLYDRDIPEIRAVVDWYEGHLVVGEYARAQTDAVEDWVGTMGRACAAALGLEANRVHTRARQTQPMAGPRFARLAASGEKLAVREGALRFWVKLDDHLDTGLFPDHRLTRARVMAESAGRRVLNLYGYTGAFSCAAAKGGAASTTTVDPSGRYLAWAEENLALNGLAGPVNATVRDDAMAFLASAARRAHRWDLVILDPPSFPTRGPAGDLDVLRDHRSMIEAVLAVLTPGGALWFSTRHQRFVPQLEGLAARVVELTAETVPEDYRNHGVHRCWRIAT